MKRLGLLLLLGCTVSPTAVGEYSACPAKAVVNRRFSLRGDPNLYVLEVALCAYKIDGQAVLPVDSLVIVVLRDQLEKAAR